MDTPESLLTVLMRKLDLQDGVVRAEVSPAPDATAATVLPPKPEPKGKGKPTPKAPVVAQTSAPAKSKPPAAKTPVAAEGEPAVKPAPVVSTRSGHYFVQVGAFSSKANADGSARKVGGTSSQSGKLWRVRTGPFASEADAKAALAKAKGAGYSDARIQRAD
jgi:rare lipoprotein A